jgi:hypothetical protein
MHPNFLKQFDFIKGQRVRLTPKYAAALNKRKRNRIDWTTREGNVHSNSRNGIVHIKWDGHRSWESVPRQGVELV